MVNTRDNHLKKNGLYWVWSVHSCTSRLQEVKVAFCRHLNDVVLIYGGDGNTAANDGTDQSDPKPGVVHLVSNAADRTESTAIPTCEREPTAVPAPLPPAAVHSHRPIKTLQCHGSIAFQVTPNRPQYHVEPPAKSVTIQNHVQITQYHVQPLKKMACTGCGTTTPAHHAQIAIPHSGLQHTEIRL